MSKLPDDVEFSNRVRVIPNLFTSSAPRSDLQKQLPRLHHALAMTEHFGSQWPKKSARVSTDVREDVIRAVALPRGLVDTKVCAINDTWSGLS